MMTVEQITHTHTEQRVVGIQDGAALYFVNGSLNIHILLLCCWS